MTTLRPSRSRWRIRCLLLSFAAAASITVTLAGTGVPDIGKAGAAGLPTGGSAPPLRFTWSSAATTVQPPPLKFASSAYDSDNDTIVLFGGEEADGALSDNTWIWDGSAWTDYPGSEIQAPPARQMASMAFDPQLHQLILFGGQGIGGQILGDTWAWNGASWFQQTTTAGVTTPPPREAASLAYDGSGQLVMFGGTGQVGLLGNGSLPTVPTILPSATSTLPTTTTSLPAAPTVALGDTWLWNGTTWTESSATGPSARSGAAMSYDSADNDTVLFGGETTPADSTSPNLVGDTWTWSGSTWTLASPHTSPEPRVWAGLGDVVPAHGVVLVAGSGTHGVLGDTWLWNGSDWTRPPVTGGLSPRSAATTAYSATSDQVVLFGGIAPGGTVLGDTVMMTTMLGDVSGSGPAVVSTTTVPAHSTRPSIRPAKAGASAGSVPNGISAGSDPLAVTATTLRRGEMVTLAGSGFGPGSTVTITFHSIPQIVGWATADRRGSFQATVAVPQEAAGGAHHFEASGQSPSGRVAQLVVAVEVVGVPGRSTASPGQTLVMVAIALFLPLAAWLGMGGAGWARSRRRRLTGRASG
jgi:galactose oxidase-like protein